VHTSGLEIALASAKECPKLKHIIVINDDGQPIPEGAMNLEDLLQDDEKRLTKTHEEVHRRSNLHPYLIPYSSGTVSTRLFHRAQQFASRVPKTL
jgi:acyl-coenzyme A synthetase/AMP-(fatty) acid ligase